MHNDQVQQRHHALGRFSLDQHHRGIIHACLLFPAMAPSRGPQPLARTLQQTLKAHKGAVNVATYAKGTAKYLLSGGQDRIIRLWNPSLGTQIKAYSAHGYEVLSIAVYVSSLIVRPTLVIHTHPLTPPVVLMIIANSRLPEVTGLSSYGM